MYDRNTLTRVKDMNRMTRVSYLEWVSHQDFKNITYVGFLSHFVCVFCLCLCLCCCLFHCLCLCICVLLLFLNSFHHNLSEYVWWSLRAVILIIFGVMTDRPTYSNSTFRLSPSGSVLSHWLMFSIYSMFSVFSMFSQLTPCSPVGMAGWSNL